MKLTKKDILILVIPVVVMLILLPILPDKLPMQWNINGDVNWYLDKNFSFLLGFLPFIIYKLYIIKHGYK